MGLLGTIIKKIVTPVDLTDDTRGQEEFERRLKFNHKTGHYDTIKVKIRD